MKIWSGGEGFAGMALKAVRRRGFLIFLPLFSSRKKVD